MSGREGYFLTLDGIEGCGKSTQADILYRRLQEMMPGTVLTFEPGGTVTGKAIREILLDPERDNLSLTAEVLLLEAARAQLIEEIILPALTRGMVVICDRFFDATMAYQVYGRGADAEYVKTIERFSVKGVFPDRTVIFDIDAERGLRRAQGDDRFERMSLDFHRRVRDGYLKLAEKDRARIRVLKADDSVESISEALWKIVKEDIKEKTGRCL